MSFLFVKNAQISDKNLKINVKNAKIYTVFNEGILMKGRKL